MSVQMETKTNEGAIPDEIWERTQQHWEILASKALVGRRIVAVRYLSEREVQQLGWDSSAVVIELDNGEWLWPSRDDEGNDAGVLLSSDVKVPLLPTISVYPEHDECED